MEVNEFVLLSVSGLGGVERFSLLPFIEPVKVPALKDMSTGYVVGS